jgi:hypothetical protein
VKPELVQAAALCPTMKNKSPNIEWLAVHPGKTFEQLLRDDLTPEERKDYEASRDATVFFCKAVEFGREKFKKRRSSQMAKLVARFWKLAAADPRKPRLDADASRLIHQAIEELDERFFKAFGRALSSKKKPQAFGNELDLAILKLKWEQPSISAKDAVDQLQKLGFSISNDGYRTELRRLRKMKTFSSPEWQLLFRKRKAGAP